MSERTCLQEAWIDVISLTWGSLGASILGKDHVGGEGWSLGVWIEALVILLGGWLFLKQLWSTWSRDVLIIILCCSDVALQRKLARIDPSGSWLRGVDMQITPH